MSQNEPARSFPQPLRNRLNFLSPSAGAMARAGHGDRHTVYPTRGLSRFLETLRATESAPVVVDLGPALGSNVSFLGEHLGCTLHVENLLANLAAWTVADEATPRARLGSDADSVDGVLCWDVLDYLDGEPARALAGELTRVLRPGGVLFICHRAENRSAAGPVRYEIVDEMTLRYSPSDDRVPPPRVWHSRQVTGLFPQLTVTDSFLLTSRMREIVLRKPAASRLD